MAQDTIFKETMLLYLQQALERQEYEDCPELINVAKKHGALQGDIDDIITAHLRTGKAQGPLGAVTNKNRLRLLKEKK